MYVDQITWWIPLSLGLVIVALSVWIRKYNADTTDYTLPPGSMGWPVIGETIPFLADGKKYMEERLAKHGPIFKSSLIGSPTIVVSGASNVRQVLTADTSLLTHAMPESACALMGPGALSTSSGLKHRTLHKAVLHTFTYDHLDSMTIPIQNIIRDYVARWRSGGHVVFGVEECRNLSFTVATKVLLGLDFDDELMNRVMRIFDMINDAFFTFPVNIPGFTYYKGRQARKEMLVILQGQLTKMLQQSEQDTSNDSRDYSITLLKQFIAKHLSLNREPVSADDGPPLEPSDPQANKTSSFPEEVLNNSLELVFGSHETIASTCCALVIMLTENKDIFDKIHDELKEWNIEVDSGGDGKALNDVTFQHLAQLKYVNSTMKEVLRLMPPIAGGFRKTQVTTKIGEFLIPKGWSILYHIPATHNLSPMFSSETDKFKPDRWMNTDSDDRSDSSEERTCSMSKIDERFQYIPFGGGVRKCVGKEFAKLVLQLFIIELVRTGTWKLVNGVPQMRTAPIPFPKDGLPLEFSSMS